MRTKRSLFCVIATAGALGAVTPEAVGSPDQTPTPVPGSPDCAGLFIAGSNHESGPFGPSGNPTASAGPGSFLGSDTHPVVAAVVGAYC
jgi:hypothetical protein